MYEDKQNNYRKHKGKVEPEFAGETDACAGIRFFDKVIPSPSIAGNAEQQVYQGTQRQQVIADQEIFKSLYVKTQDGNVFPDGHSQNAGKG